MEMSGDSWAFSFKWIECHEYLLNELIVKTIYDDISYPFPTVAKWAAEFISEYPFRR